MQLIQMAMAKMVKYHGYGDMIQVIKISIDDSYQYKNAMEFKSSNLPNAMPILRLKVSL
jgi:hypothetical protein